MIWGILLATLTLGLLLFWELHICEGTHLGRRIVVWLYDRIAARYDRIKRFDQDWEGRFLGEPLANLLQHIPGATLLDIGAGTGRVARALLPLWNKDGMLINLEPAERMIAQGQAASPSDRTQWIKAFAVPLPFMENSFDIVVSLEVLEFTPDPHALLREAIRVLLPGGWLLITNRIGWEATWILGHTFSRSRFPQVLARVGFRSIHTYPWQLDYDLTWAQKPCNYDSEEGEL
jgi:ubiquinone/menaquinone biosynthesis C-methylase UbiE